MTKILIALLLSLVTACGGSDSGGQQGTTVINQPQQKDGEQ